ncbi:MAG: acyltransferase [Alphaproteobacteria bacterium]|nr:acyltransferase [Alphaproteobacteria bacterium]MBO7641774.1 acyltransferase [Alphaproteobacteria bacterium]
MKQPVKFFDDIEKLRGFACILVLFQHLIWICPYYFVISIVPDWLSIGSGAVHIFFAISGFVITYSLSSKLENLNGNFLENLKNSRDWISKFYSKRFFRIFPLVLVVTIICGFYLQMIDAKPDWQSALLRSPLEILFGTFNNSVENFVSQNVIYISGMGPFWTLAVEAQFYVLWPLVLIFCKNDNQRATVSLLLGLIFALFVTPLSNLYLGDHYYWTLNNVAELFLGSFLAYLYKSGFKINLSKVEANFFSLFFVFAIWFYPSALKNVEKVFFGNIVETISSVFLVMLCVFCEGSFSFLGFNKIFTYLGKKSFSFYSIQLTLANVVIWFTNSIYFPKDSLSKNEFFFYQFLIFLGLLLASTELLYRFIERPSRQLGR